MPFIIWEGIEHPHSQLLESVHSLVHKPEINRLEVINTMMKELVHQFLIYEENFISVELFVDITNFALNKKKRKTLSTSFHSNIFSV